MRNILILFILSLVFAVSCTACPECGKHDDILESSDPDFLEIPDPDIDKECSPYNGKCKFAETEICKDDAVYGCQQVLKDGCVVGYEYKWTESCPFGCKVDISPSDTQPGVVHCIPVEEALCPDFSLIDFPLRTESGENTFCRKCDPPPPGDPLCIENLWKKSNEKLCVDKPTFDCCGYSCEMDALKPQYMEDITSKDRPSQAIGRCDILLNPKNPSGWKIYGSYYSDGYPYTLSHGKIGFRAFNANIREADYQAEYYANNRYFEYDIQTQKYRVVAGNTERELGYYNSAFLGVVFNLQKNKPESAGYPFLIDKDGKRKVLNWTKYSLRSTPILTDKWILINVHPPAAGLDDDTLYGRVDQPTLSTIGRPLYNTRIVDDTLVFINTESMYNRMGYICNLASEESVLDSCEVFNRSGDTIDSLQLDRENPYLIYYSDSVVPGKMIQVDTTTSPFSYREFNIASTNADFLRTRVLSVRGKMALIKQEWTGEDRESRICYYRLDSEKLFCSDPILWGEKNVYSMDHGDFEDHTFVWADYTALKLRDMECYCDWHSELCPFDDYTPNTEHPKEKGFQDKRL